MILQIQPRFSEFEQWKALAAQQGLCFELSELSLPGVVYTGEMLRTCRDTGLVRSLHGAFIDVNPASADPAFRALSRQRCEESCALAAELGADNVVFHCSCFPFLRGGYLAQWAESCAEFYRSLAERFPLTLFIENSMDTDPEPLKVLMELVGSSRLGVCLDIGHASFSRVPVDRWFEALRGHIRYLHLSDNHGLFDDHLSLGEGSIDWQHVNGLWREAGTVECMTLEVGGLESTRRSVAYLQSNNLFVRE